MKKPKTNHFQSVEDFRVDKRSNGRAYTVRSNRDRFFFPDEWFAFYDQLKGRQKITFEFLINTGARIKEIQMIQVKDVDFQRNNIVLRFTKAVVSRPGKDKTGTRKIRVLTISSQFAKYLKKVIRQYKLKPEDKFPVLSTPAGNIAMKKALEKAGIKDWKMFSLHNCRKTLETWLLALGIETFKILKHFGHSFAVASKHYVAPDIFSWEDKNDMRKIVGDLFEK